MALRGSPAQSNTAPSRGVNSFHKHVRPESLSASYPCQNGLPKADGLTLAPALKPPMILHIEREDLQTLSCLATAHKTQITCCFLLKLPASPQVMISCLPWPSHFPPTTMALMRLQRIVKFREQGLNTPHTDSRKSVWWLEDHL